LLATFRDDPKYLTAFVRMIGTSLPYTFQADASYSESLASVTGRCLALVDFGVSLELAQEPRRNESTVNSTPLELPLEEYEFPVVMGERDQHTDGLVAYFRVLPERHSRSPDLGLCYTHFPQDNSNGKMKGIEAGNLPALKARHISVLSLLDDDPDRNNPTKWAAKDFDLAAKYDRAYAENGWRHSGAPQSS
jgi:hypothetical protein